MYTRKLHIIIILFKNDNVFQDQGIEIWSKPIEPKNKQYYSYAIAFVNRRTIGTPFPYNITLNHLGLYNPIGYKIKVGIMF